MEASVTLRFRWAVQERTCHYWRAIYPRDPPGKPRRQSRYPTNLRLVTDISFSVSAYSFFDSSCQRVMEDGDLRHEEIVPPNPRSQRPRWAVGWNEGSDFSGWADPWRASLAVPHRIAYEMRARSASYR